MVMTKQRLKINNSTWQLNQFIKPQLSNYNYRDKAPSYPNTERNTEKLSYLNSSKVKGRLRIAEDDIPNSNPDHESEWRNQDKE